MIRSRVCFWEQLPALVGSVALYQRAECQNGLSTFITPSISGAFHALGHRGVAWGLDDARYSREAACFHLRVIDPVTMSAEVDEFGREFLAPGMLVAKIDEARMTFSTSASPSRRT